MQLGCVVEGHGDVAAVPILVRRLRDSIAPSLPLIVRRPVRVKRDRLSHAGELERAIQLAAPPAEPVPALLVLVDAEADCAAQLGPELGERATDRRPDLAVAVVLAVREFECWFLAAAESLRGHRALADNLAAPDKPEGIGGAKAWLRARMPAGRTYSETADQPALAAVMDIQAARRAPSFDRLWREMEGLLRGS